VDVLAHPLLAAAFFKSRRQAVPAGAVLVDVGGARIACSVTPGTPTVLYFAGNGETVAAARRGIGAELTALGLGVFLTERRGVGGSTGQQTFPALLDDAERLLRATETPPERVVAFGRSLGSLAAVELASRHRLAGLVLESAIADLGERIRAQLDPAALGVTPEHLDAAVHERFDQKQKLARHRAPTLVLHAGTDERIDRSHALRLAMWAGSADKELVIFPRGGHADVLAANRKAYARALREFFARL